MPTETSLGPKKHILPGTSAGPGAQSTHTDWLLADAIAHLLLAYEAIDVFSQDSTKSWNSPTFVSTCRLLCATLAAIDEFSESMWADY